MGEIDFERDLNLVCVVHSFKMTLIHLSLGRSGPMVVDNGAMGHVTWLVSCNM